MDETDEPLARLEAENAAGILVVGDPPGGPVSGKAQRLGGQQQLHRRVAGRQHLLELRYLYVRRRGAHYRDNHRRLRQPVAILSDHPFVEAGLLARAEVCQKRTRLPPGVAPEHDEPPRRQLAVIGNAGRDGEDLGKLRFVRRRLGEKRSGNGFTAFEKIEGIAHDGDKWRIPADRAIAKKRRALNSPRIPGFLTGDESMIIGTWRGTLGRASRHWISGFFGAAAALAVTLAGALSAEAQSLDPPMPNLSPARAGANVEMQTGVGGPASDAEEALPFDGESPMELRPSADTLLSYPEAGDGAIDEFGSFDDGLGLPGALAPDAGPPTDIRPGTFTLEARMAADAPPLGDGVKWRIFGSLPGADGHLPLLGEAEGGIIYIRLDQGTYYVHAAYGRAGATRKIDVDGPTGGEVFVLNAGGMRLIAMNGEDQQLGPGEVYFDIYAPDEGGSEERYLLVPNAPPGRVIALNAGTYHVVCRYGDANAVIRADVRVDPGKLTETTLFQKAARLTLKLVEEHGGEAIADTAWVVLTQGGDAVVESVGAFPSVVLSEGSYTAVARHNGRAFQANFTVVPGLNRDVEVLAN